MINRKFVLPYLLALNICFLSAAAATLRVGAARIDITPPGDPAHPASGKYEHERLYVRAIVLDNGAARAALIGADQAGLPEVVWTTASKQIAKELDCPIPNIIMSATHTHSGWGSHPRHVVLTTTDSNIWGGASGHTYNFTRQPDGTTDIDVVIVREGKNLKGWLLGFVLATSGKGVLQNAFVNSVRAIEAGNGAETGRRAA